MFVDEVERALFVINDLRVQIDRIKDEIVSLIGNPNVSDDEKVLLKSTLIELKRIKVRAKRLAEKISKERRRILRIIVEGAMPVERKIRILPEVEERYRRLKQRLENKLRAFDNVMLDLELVPIIREELRVITFILSFILVILDQLIEIRETRI